MSPFLSGSGLWFGHGVQVHQEEGRGLDPGDQELYPREWGFLPTVVGFFCSRFPGDSEPCMEWGRMGLDQARLSSTGGSRSELALQQSWTGMVVVQS